MQEQKSTGTSEMKAFGQELLDLGARYMKAGKAWLNHRRNEMNDEYARSGNRQRNQHNQQSRDHGRNGQSGQQWYGQYRGSDYEDPRAQGESDFGGTSPSNEQGDTTDQRYSGYSESGRYHSQDQRSQNQHPQSRQWDENGGQGGYDDDFRSMGGGQSRNTGGYGGYADEQDGRGRNQSGSRRNAQEQYGDPRGQGGSAQGNYGQAGQSTYGQSNYGQSGQGSYGQRGQGNYSPSGQQGIYGQSGQGGYDRSEQGGYSQSGQRGHGHYGQSGQHGGHAGDRGSVNGHRGKGPRSYSRSDERLTEDLNEQLMQDDDIDATDINVRVENGEVTLEGTVTERWMKHRVEDLAERCSGVKDVDNRIRVKKSGADEIEDGGSPSLNSPASARGGTSTSTGAAGRTGPGSTGNGGASGSGSRSSGKTT